MYAQEHYRGFVFTWQDPAPTGEGYQINISSEDLRLNDKLQAGDQVRPATHVLKEAQLEAQRFIDDVLRKSPSGGAL